MERRAGAAPPRQLPPGFRFHPTDVELVVQYLLRKALARPLPAAVIPVVHSAALPDPWDLPGASEGEAAYFFSMRQAPARGGGARRRRAASGYWEATGKEKPVCLQLQCPSGRGRGKQLLVGVKTALAFHRGKGGKARSSRTDWVMHEYRLAAAAAPRADKKMSANDLQSRGAEVPGEWVVCRVTLKSRARRQAAGGDTTAASVAHRAASDDHQPSPSSSCVTDTCHASVSDHQEEVSTKRPTLAASQPVSAEREG
ncbi:unnamed protein product [Alopecurus aequalis]